MSERRAHEYDLFVSYVEADRAWVEGYLLDALTRAGVGCHSEAAFALGAPRILEFERAVRDSARTLLVLSPAYLAGGLAQFTDLLAQSYGLETATWPVIPLLLHPVELPPRLAMLTALDATDPGQWPAVVERLCAELQRPVPGPAPPPPCPYPGMVPFRAGDARFFYGREDEIRHMLQHLRHQRLLFVIGPSGCGKSSLISAGLLPKLAGSSYFAPGFWLVRDMRPGAWPLQALAGVLGGDPAQPDRAVADLLAAHAPARRLLLVVDQFEELFSQAERAEQARFLATLQALRAVEGCTLLLAMRADFYPDLMNSDLWPLDAGQRLEIAPLRGEALRRAIRQPAGDVGVYLEAGLLERLLADAADEPGVLPLLQETMVLLWDEMQNRLLPLAAYQRLGGEGRSGLAVAIATKADASLAELGPARQAIARRVFVRLVQFGEGRPDMRRQQPVADLRSADDDPGEFERTLEHLARNRLLTLGGEEGGDDRRADISHEALIGGWPALGGWLAARREAEQARRGLEAKAAEWLRLGRGSGGLLDPVELLEAERWLAGPDAADLGYGQTLPALVGASRAAEEEAAAQRRRTARFRFAALGAIVLLIVAAMGIGLWSARQLAQQERDAAETAQVLADARAAALATSQALAGEKAAALATSQVLAGEKAAALATSEADRDRAEQQAREARFALSGQLAAQAQAALEAYPQRSLLLAVEALSVTLRAGDPRAPAAEDALRQALANAGGRGLGGKGGAINALAISPDGRWLAATSWDGPARLWDLIADPAAGPIVLGGHEDVIYALAISPDGHWLATGDRDGIARMWDLSADDPAAAPTILRGHEDWVNAVAFSPDGRWLVTGSVDDTARLWDLTAADPAAVPIVLRGHQAAIEALAISLDGRWLVTGSWDYTARLWDLAAADPAADSTVLPGHGGIVKALAISPDGRWLVTGSEDGTARLWNLSADDPAAASTVLLGHEGGINAVAFSPDGRWLATGSLDSTARLWDLTAAHLAASSLILAGHESSIEALAFSPDNHWLVTGSSDGTARIWDLTWHPEASSTILRGHEDSVDALAISPDSRWLVTGSGDSTARLWDLAATDPAAAPIVLPGHEEDILSVAISPDNRWLVSTSWDGTAHLWDLTADPAAGPVVLRGHGDAVYALAFSPDSRWLLAGDLGGIARLWDLTAADPAAASTVLPGQEGEIYAAAFSPDGYRLVTGSQGATTVCLWNLTAEGSVADPIVLRGHEGIIFAVAVTPEGRWLATGDQDGIARLWDLAAEDPSATSTVLPGHDGPIYAVAISPDGRWLVTGSWDSTARLWDLSAEDPAAAPTVLPGHEGPIYAVAISPDGRWLVTGSSDGTARLWDLHAEDPAAAPTVLRGYQGEIHAVAISPDGHWLVTCSRGGTAHLWNLRLDELIDLACRTAGRNLIPTEWELYFPGQPHRKTCARWPLPED